MRQRIAPRRAPAGTAQGAQPPAAAETGSWSSVVKLLAVVAGVLVVVGTTLSYLDDSIDQDRPGIWRGALDITARRLTLDAEATVPAWFSAVLLALTAVTFLVIGALVRRSGGATGRYTVLGLFAAYLSADEGASLHENLGPIAEQVVGSDVLPTFSWLVPGALLALLAGVVLLRVARGLPAVLRRRLLLAGLLFLLGALGMEVVGSPLYDPSLGPCPAGRTGSCLVPQSGAYWLLNGVEEGLEMTGALLALRAGLLMIRVQGDAGATRVDLAVTGPVRSPAGLSR